MLIKTFELNKNGKIELTSKELENLMRAAYIEGQEYERNKNNHYTYWNYPYSIKDVTYSTDTPCINGGLDTNSLGVNNSEADLDSTTIYAVINKNDIEGVVNSSITAEAALNNLADTMGIIGTARGQDERH